MFHVKHSFPLGAPTRSDRTDTPAGLRGSRRLGAARFGYADRIGALPKRTCAPRIPASPGMRPRADDPSARMHPAGARSPYACARLAGAPSARTYPAGARSARLRPGRPPRRAFAPPQTRPPQRAPRCCFPQVRFRHHGDASRRYVFAPLALSAGALPVSPSRPRPLARPSHSRPSCTCHERRADVSSPTCEAEPRLRSRMFHVKHLFLISFRASSAARLSCAVAPALSHASSP